MARRAAAPVTLLIRQLYSSVINGGMNKEYARKLPASAQEEKRKLAIKLWKKNKRIKDIAEIVDVTPKAVGGWIKQYQAKGASALRSQKRGRRMGQNRHLTNEQEAELQRLIKDKAPDQLKLDYVLWTRKAVMELIEQEAGIKMPIRTVGEYLRRLDIHRRSL